MKKILSICIVFSIIMCYFTNVFAASAEYEEADTKSKEAQSQLDEVQSSKYKVLQEVQEIQEKINKTEQEIKEKEEKIDELTKSIEKSEAKIKEKEAEFKKKENTLKERMVVLYEKGQTSYLEVLLTSKSITDFISRYYIMSEIAQADTEVMNEIKAAKQEIETEKNKMEKEKSDLDIAKNELQTKNKELVSNKEEKQLKVQSLSEEEKKLQDEIDEYESTKRRIEALEEERRRQAQAAASSSSSSSSSYYDDDEPYTYTSSGSGKLAWPVPGYTTITSEYGYRIHPIYGYLKLHNGIDVGAPGGAKFVAADDGVVILAEYYGGYGNCVVIDHGNGMFTRYAHGTTILVSEGQRVTRGTPVLTVGSTGLSTGNHAHFEVSINGSTVDPLDYL